MSHPSGTKCPQGTSKVPDNFVPCCAFFESHTKNCYYDIRFEWWTNLAGGWVIVISPDAGGGGIAINYCPSCGRKL